VAGTSLLALLDDIASLLDDIATMTKVAAKKTAGVLGDDLALNAEQVSGIRAERELPVVWAVAKGSLKNKLILVPAALIISALAPWAIAPLLMIGGVFLCYEGFEKIAHKVLHGSDDSETSPAEKLQVLDDPELDLVAYEREKVQGAIRTDFVLSAEIIVIALGAVQGAVLQTQVVVVSAIAVLMTVGVYAVVAGIVKLDDAGLYLLRTQTTQPWGKVRQTLGKGLLRLAPYLMKALSIVGTAAMFMVGGGILVHGLPGSHEVLHHWSETVRTLPGLGTLLAGITPPVLNILAGVVAGGIALAMVGAAGKMVAWFKISS